MLKTLKTLATQIWAVKKREKLPIIQLALTQKRYDKSRTSPSPDLDTQILDCNATSVGSLVYAVSPLVDHLYIYHIEIEPEHRRNGYAFAALLHLHQQYRLPMSAIHETFEASRFWTAARKLSIGITEGFSNSDLDDEKKRWAHLEPLAAATDAAITERLIRGEEYYLAVGRGIGHW